LTEKKHGKNKPCSDELLAALSANIKRFRAERGWSQEKLAEKSGMHRTFVSLVERKGRNVTLGVVEAFAETLGVDVPTLLTKHQNCDDSC